MVDFMSDVLRARRFFLDPVNHDEAVGIVSKFTKQPLSFFAGWVFTNKDNYRDPDGLPNLQAMQSNINLQREIGIFFAFFIDWFWSTSRSNNGARTTSPGVPNISKAERIVA